jgi:16S rRNA (guanine527-N7)-methyltransferase
VKQSALSDSLADYLVLLGVQLDTKRIDTLTHHLALVIEANERVNLTRVTDPLTAVRLHTGDSLSVLEDVLGSPDGTILDLGSGAGFPGIPIAVASDRSVVLLDSVAKKVVELRGIVTALGLEGRVSALNGRAEALARLEEQRYSVVVARAVSELPALVELASPLLAPQGRLLCMKGSPSIVEVERGDKVAAKVGMRLEYRRDFDLPEGFGHRSILCYSKISKSAVTLPRREGLAQHSPLA